MAGMVYAEQVEDPAGVVASLGPTHAFLEGPALTEMRDCQDSPPMDWPWINCDRGVAFGAVSEVQFRRRRDKRWHLVLVTELDTSPGEPWLGWKELRPDLDWRSQAILWGEPDAEAGVWVEGRIPHALTYRFRTDIAGSRVAAIIKRYFLPGSEKEIRRYTGLKLLDRSGREITDGTAAV